MGAVNKRGVWVPGANDDLLAGWQTMAGQIGAYVPVASVAAARALLDQAQAAGIGATTSSPILFLVGSGAQKVAYTADGSKSNSIWVLAPINEVTYKADTYETPAWTGYKPFSVAAGASSRMMKSNLAAAPYARVAHVVAAAYGRATAGNPRLRLNVHGGGLFYGRFDSSEDTCMAAGMCVIPANASPDITVSLFGGGSTSSTVELSGEENQSALLVMAFPITMSA